MPNKPENFVRIDTLPPWTMPGTAGRWWTAALWTVLLVACLAPLKVTGQILMYPIGEPQPLILEAGRTNWFFVVGIFSDTQFSGTTD